MDPRQETPGTVDAKLLLEGRSTDWHLQQLVSLANEHGLEVGITLIVAGSVISGMLVGGQKYFELFAKEFAAVWPRGEGKEAIRAAFAINADIYDKPGSKPATPPQFIHLNNAKCFYPGGEIPNNQGVLWRGRINAISGFSLGAMSTTA